MDYIIATFNIENKELGFKVNRHFRDLNAFILTDNILKTYYNKMYTNPDGEMPPFSLVVDLSINISNLLTRLHLFPFDHNLTSSVAYLYKTEPKYIADEDAEGIVKGLIELYSGSPTTDNSEKTATVVTEWEMTDEEFIYYCEIKNIIIDIEKQEKMWFTLLQTEQEKELVVSIHELPEITNLIIKADDEDLDIIKKTLEEINIPLFESVKERTPLGVFWENLIDDFIEETKKLKDEELKIRLLKDKIDRWTKENKNSD